MNALKCIEMDWNASFLELHCACFFWHHQVELSEYSLLFPHLDKDFPGGTASCKAKHRKTRSQGQFNSLIASCKQGAKATALVFSSHPEISLGQAEICSAHGNPIRGVFIQAIDRVTDRWIGKTFQHRFGPLILEAESWHKFAGEQGSFHMFLPSYVTLNPPSANPSSTPWLAEQFAQQLPCMPIKLLGVPGCSVLEEGHKCHHSMFK